MKLSGEHQELFEQMMILAVAVIEDNDTDIQDFVHWFEDYYVEDDVIDRGMSLHRLRQNMNAILVTIREAQK